MKNMILLGNTQLICVMLHLLYLVYWNIIENNSLCQNCLICLRRQRCNCFIWLSAPPILSEFSWKALLTKRSLCPVCFGGQVECVTLCGDTAAACESKMKAAFQRAELHPPCVLLLKNLHLLGQRQDRTKPDSRVASAVCQLISDARSR